MTTRVVFCCAALAALCSVSRAERIHIMGVVANYVTARDAVDIEIWLDRAPDLTREFVTLEGGNGLNVGVKFKIDNRDAIPDRLNLTTGRVGGGGPMQERVFVPDIPTQTRQEQRDSEMRHIIAMSFPADTLRFDEFTPNASGELRFVWAASVQYVHDGHAQLDHANGWSTVDAHELVHAPEPSSLVLIGLSHLLWLPRFRQLCRKRRSAEYEAA